MAPLGPREAHVNKGHLVSSCPRAPKICGPALLWTQRGYLLLRYHDLHVVPDLTCIRTEGAHAARWCNIDDRPYGRMGARAIHGNHKGVGVTREPRQQQHTRESNIFYSEGEEGCPLVLENICHCEQGALAVVSP
jgi:hypothetical protein